MIELSKDIYIYGIWFCGNGKQDWMACLSRKDGEGWKLQYRFRYYSDDLAFESKDTKNWYSFTCTDSSDECGRVTAEKVNELVHSMLGRDMGTTIDFVDLQCRGDDPKVFFEMGSRPWSNMKVMSKEEAIAAGFTCPSDDDQSSGSVQ